MKKFLQKIFDKLGRKGFLALIFIPLAIWGFYSNGWSGLIATILGWCIGGFIYNRWLDKLFFKDKSRRVH